MGSTPVAPSDPGEAEARDWSEIIQMVISRPGGGRQLRQWRDDQTSDGKATGQAAFLGHESGSKGA